jgi:hypothetical protein
VSLRAFKGAVLSGFSFCHSGELCPYNRNAVISCKTSSGISLRPKRAADEFDILQDRLEEFVKEVLFPKAMFEARPISGY